MVRIFKTIDGAIHEIQEPQEGCWIALTNPTATEIFEISEQFGIEVDDLRAPLDEEERSRIEVEDNYTLILADVPTIEERNEKDWYVTIPLGIIVTQKMIFTVCLEDTQVLTRFMEGRVRNFFTYMKTRFILQILYRNASMYLRYLRIIDKKSEQIEEKLHLGKKYRCNDTRHNGKNNNDQKSPRRLGKRHSCCTYVHSVSTEHNRRYTHNNRDESQSLHDNVQVIGNNRGKGSHHTAQNSTVDIRHLNRLRGWMF